ncbi:MAG TPA: hypothetical protein VFF50_02625, partial [Candidatus Deferrimicrobiaceae bacterium]|nr:hypothetical protein [Candidatus Deferrimicrobiaceae bacterium]
MGFAFAIGAGVTRAGGLGRVGSMEAALARGVAFAGGLPNLGWNNLSRASAPAWATAGSGLGDGAGAGYSGTSLT